MLLVLDYSSLTLIESRYKLNSYLYCCCADSKVGTNYCWCCCGGFKILTFQGVLLVLWLWICVERGVVVVGRFNLNLGLQILLKVLGVLGQSSCLVTRRTFNK